MSRPAHVLHEALDANGDGVPDSYVTVSSFGARGDGGDDYQAFADAAAALETGDVLYIPRGTFLLSQTLEITARRITIICDGIVSPYGSFDDYLFHFKKPDSGNDTVADFQGNINITRLRIDGLWQSRGIKFTQIDDSLILDVILYRCYGTALKVNNLRETTFVAPRVISGLYREAFTAPSAWDSGTAYNVGDRVELTYSAYASGTSYSVNSYVSKGGYNFRSLTGSNQGNDPETDNVNWVWEPRLFYECQIAHTNEDPLTQNTNNATEGNRYWKQVYFYEAGIDFNQDETTNDATNSVDIIKPVVRNSDYETLMRIDCTADNGITRGIDIFSPHLHAVEQTYVTQDSNLGINSGVAIRDYGHVIELGRTRFVNIHGGQLRCGVSIERMVACRFGGDQTQKLADFNYFGALEITGEGNGQIGLLRGEHMNEVDQSHFLDARSNLTGTGARDLVNLNFDTPFEGVVDKVGSGSPESVVVADIGSTYRRTDGSTGTSFYVKESGTGNTGWVAK